MFPRSAVSHSVKNLSPPANVKVKVTLMKIVPSKGASETTAMAVRMTKLNVAYCRHEDVLLQVNQIKDLEIALRNISNVQVVFLVQSFHVYGFENAREHSPSQLPPRRAISRGMRVLCRPLLAFSMNHRSLFCWMGGIGFKRCTTFRWLEILTELRIFG